MKEASGCKTAAITAATLAISLLIGTGISDAMQSTSAIKRAGAVRTPAIRAQSFGAKSSHMTIHKAGAKRVRVDGVQ
jgi:hypothetical protein